MNIDKEVEFQRKWNRIFKIINRSKIRCKINKIIKLGNTDFYIHRFKGDENAIAFYYVKEYSDDYYITNDTDYISIKKDWNIYYNIVLYKNEVYDFYINGWNKNCVLENLKRECKNIQKKIDILDFEKDNFDEKDFFDNNHIYKNIYEYEDFYYTEIEDLESELKDVKEQKYNMLLEKNFMTLFESL